MPVGAVQASSEECGRPGRGSGGGAEVVGPPAGARSVGEGKTRSMPKRGGRAPRPWITACGSVAAPGSSAPNAASQNGFASTPGRWATSRRGRSGAFQTAAARVSPIGGRRRENASASLPVCPWGPFPRLKERGLPLAPGAAASARQVGFRWFARESTISFRDGGAVASPGLRFPGRLGRPARRKREQRPRPFRFPQAQEGLPKPYAPCFPPAAP